MSAEENTEEVGIRNESQVEEGELEDADNFHTDSEPVISKDETTNVADDNGTMTNREEGENNIPETEDDTGEKIDMTLDVVRADEEQLDYDEDDLEDGGIPEKQLKEDDSNKPSEATTEISVSVSGLKIANGLETSKKESTSGGTDAAEKEADSESEGEIRSEDEGEIKENENDAPKMVPDDLEEGETRDHPLDAPPEQKKICKFFEMGSCTWGDRCRFSHPGVNDKGKYNMFDNSEKAKSKSTESHMVHMKMAERPPHMLIAPPMHIAPVHTETAWERGLRHAKELKRQAMQKKVQEPDFVQKREVLSLNRALNEDHDMQFVDYKPLAPQNRGYDPFEEIEEDEYAIPSPGELRARGPLRHPEEKRHLPEHPHMYYMKPQPPMPYGGMPPADLKHRDKGGYPMDVRRSPLKQRENGRESYAANIPPPKIPAEHLKQGLIKDPSGQGRTPENQYGNVRQESKYPVQGSTPQVVQGNDRKEAWSDPWARARPMTKGRKRDSPGSKGSSSSGSSSSRSSSRSSFSSSSDSKSSRSSSHSSASSRSSSYSSHSDSSRSPSPQKQKPKKKVLTKKLPTVTKTAAPNAPIPNPTSVPTKQHFVSIKPVSHQEPKAPVKTAKAQINVVQRGRQPIKKVPAKTKQKDRRSSSSSSEFSHSDSSVSPPRSKKKTYKSSGSDSDSSDSSGSSDSSDSESEDDTRRKKVKALSHGKQAIDSASKKENLAANSNQRNSKVAVPSKPGRKNVKMTIIDKTKGKPSQSSDSSRKRGASEMAGQKGSANRRLELLEQLKAVEDAIARKRAKL